MQKTFGAGPLIFHSVRDAIPRIPDYSEQLVMLIGPTELGTGFLWATLVGFIWLLAQTAVALATSRPRLSPWVLGFTHTSAMHFSIAIGAAVAFLAALELWLMYDTPQREAVPSESQENH